MIYESVLRFAEATPNRVAISRNGRDLTYREFAGRINQARLQFARAGLSNRGVTGLAVLNIQEFWIASLALRSLGHTILPIRTPEDLVALRLPDLTSVVVSARWTNVRLACARAGLLTYPLMPSDDGFVPPPPAEIADGGQLLLTSGTTGSSKMVLWTSEADAFAIQWADNFHAGMTYHVFDFGTWTAAGYLAPMAVWGHGGGIVIQQGGPRYEAFCDQRLTHALLLPYFLAEVLGAPEEAFPRNNKLKLYISGGTITSTQIREAKRRITPHLFNRLAATEVGGIASTPLITEEDQKWHQISPLRGVEIVDERHRPVPAGVVGQLRVAIGAGPTGYFADPETTAKFFHEGYFYPGDLAMSREDGRIALQGRVTDVINVHGSKVAPAAFESMIQEQFGFRAVCLVSAQDRKGEEQVYLVVESSSPLQPALVRRLQSSVTNVTVNVRTLPSLPRTQTGKIKRNEVRTLLTERVP